MSTKARVIPVESVESWAAPFRGIEDIDGPADRIAADDARRQEFEEVAEGYALLVLPDGRRFGCVATDSLGAHPTAAGISGLLRDYLLAHKTAAIHFGRAIPVILVNLATMDPRRTFCCSCAQWIDLFSGGRGERRS